jgi:hypothetical protein
MPDSVVLQGLFNLTPAEARVARGVAQRLTVDRIAGGLGRSQETVRTQLKAVLAKPARRATSISRSCWRAQSCSSHRTRHDRAALPASIPARNRIHPFG